PAPTANEHRNRCASLLRYLVWYRLSCAVLCYAAGISSSYAFDFSLYDHSTRPYFDAPFTAFDYPPLTKLYIVTGTDNWPNNNVDFFSVRVCNAQGVPLVASINIPRGTPLGTIVSTHPGHKPHDPRRQIGWKPVSGTAPTNGALQRSFNVSELEYRRQTVALHTTARPGYRFYRHLQSEGDSAACHLQLFQPRPEMDL